VEVEDQQIPRLSWQHDAMLMDLAVQFNITLAKLHQINICRKYLQLLTIFDITAVDGVHLFL
jgi:hypothetical protein